MGVVLDIRTRRRWKRPSRLGRRPGQGAQHEAGCAREATGFEQIGLAANRIVRQLAK